MQDNDVNKSPESLLIPWNDGSVSEKTWSCLMHGPIFDAVSFSPNNSIIPFIHSFNIICIIQTENLFMSTHINQAQQR